jgi:hypothetical protein
MDTASLYAVYTWCMWRHAACETPNTYPWSYYWSFYHNSSIFRFYMIGMRKSLNIMNFVINTSMICHFYLINMLNLNPKKSKITKKGS